MNQENKKKGKIGSIAISCHDQSQQTKVCCRIITLHWGSTNAYLLLIFLFFHSCVILFYFWLSRVYLHTKSLTFSSCLFRPSNFSFRQFWLFTFQHIHVSPLIFCIVSLWSLLNFFPSKFDPFIQSFNTDPTTSKSFHIGPRSSIIIWIWSFESFKKCEDQSRHFPNIKFILETCEFTLIPILLIIKYVQFD